ncbi:hypothetical protein JXA63_00460 [Candidatus Woesebacteria bacterium]|nr:hypothetical protein [Candidatus Woesebacteria bacterium]
MFKKLLILIVIVAVSFGVYKIFFQKQDSVADMCIKVADEAFEKVHGRVPARDDFVDDTNIKNDWYPAFEKCLDENQ